MSGQNDQPSTAEASFSDPTKAESKGPTESLLLEPILKPEDVKLDSVVIDALQNKVHRLAVLRIEEDMNQFMNDSSAQQRNVSGLNAFNRMLVHKIADYYLLSHSSVGVDSNTKHVNLVKLPHSRIPSPKVSEHVPAEEEPQAPTLKIMQRSTKSPQNADSAQDNPPQVPRFMLRRPEPREKKEDSVSSGPNDAPDNHSPTQEVAQPIRTLEEREEEYMKVRARIFQESESQTSSSEASKVVSPPKSQPIIQPTQSNIRNPTAAYTQSTEGRSANNPSFQRGQQGNYPTQQGFQNDSQRSILQPPPQFAGVPMGNPAIFNGGMQYPFNPNQPGGFQPNIHQSQNQGQSLNQPTPNMYSPQMYHNPNVSLPPNARRPNPQQGPFNPVNMPTNDPRQFERHTQQQAWGYDPSMQTERPSVGQKGFAPSQNYKGTSSQNQPQSRGWPNERGSFQQTHPDRGAQGKLPGQYREPFGDEKGTRGHNQGSHGPNSPEFHGYKQDYGHGFSQFNPTESVYTQPNYGHGVSNPWGSSGVYAQPPPGAHYRPQDPSLMSQGYAQPFSPGIDYQHSYQYDQSRGQHYSQPTDMGPNQPPFTGQPRPGGGGGSSDYDRRPRRQGQGNDFGGRQNTNSGMTTRQSRQDGGQHRMMNKFDGNDGERIQDAANGIQKVSLKDTEQGMPGNK